MKIEILPNFIPNGKIKNQNDDWTQHYAYISPVWESKGFITLASTVCEICNLLQR